MRLTACLALAAAWLAAAAPAHAVPVRGLYEAAVPVADQNPASREPALRAALAAVLVRLTGSRDLPAGSDAVLQRASALVQGYGYDAAPSGKGLVLRAQFDPRAVEAALRSQGLPVWGSNRFSHIVWIALRDDGQPRALLDGAGAASRAAEAIETAEARGVPVAFPSLDATDRQRVSFNEVWSGNFQGIQGASRRYNANLMLIGRVGREDGRWLARWTVMNNAGASEEWTTAESSLGAALAAGVHELADRQARRFATQSGAAQEVRVQVAGVDTLRDYGRVLNYLRGLNPVRDAQVEAAQADALTLRLRVEGDADSLARLIAAGRVLRQQDDGAFDTGQRYVLVR